MEALGCTASLGIQIGEEAEGVGVVEAALTFAAAAFHLAVVAGCIRANQLVAQYVL